MIFVICQDYDLWKMFLEPDFIQWFHLIFNVKRILVWKLFWNFHGELNLNL